VSNTEDGAESHQGDEYEDQNDHPGHVVVWHDIDNAIGDEPAVIAVIDGTNVMSERRFGLEYIIMDSGFGLEYDFEGSASQTDGGAEEGGGQKRAGHRDRQSEAVSLNIREEFPEIAHSGPL